MRLTRLAAMVGLSAAAVLPAVPASASTPASQTITPSDTPGQSVSMTWTGTVSGANASSDCTAGPTAGLSDPHTVAVTVPAGFYDTRTVQAVFSEVSASADTILTLQQGGTSLGSSDNGGTGAAEQQSVKNPTGSFNAITCAFSGAGTYTGTVTLTTLGPDAGPTPGGGGAPGVTPATYGNYTTPSYGSDAGEPSIGVDWKTGNVYEQAGLTTILAKFPGNGTGIGDPTFSNVTCPTTDVTSLDPILFTDSPQGRTVVSQLTGQDSSAAFFDTPGSCTPSQGGGIPSGVDHQTVGGGPYPKPLPATVPGPLTSFPDAIYYCSQDLETAFCARSDTGGLTFGTGNSIYTTECGGLHGHVRVSPDGTVYVPNKSCGGTQGAAVSTDAGQTFHVVHVTGSTPGDSDPSVSVGKGGRVYFGYEASSGRAQISTSDDKGGHWTSPTDVGASMGLKRTVFPEVIAGDNDRAAFAFLGTTTDGPSGDPTFGKSKDGTTYVGAEWHMYVATTYDGGQSWTTVDATPTDPVQRGDICQSGTTCGSDRNLLDFNDITVDKAGRVLVAYADGCTATCVTSTKVSDNKLTAQGVIVRQLSGMGLFADGGTGTGTGTGADPVVPETPFAALLPVGAGLALAAGWALRRRRRSGSSAA